jgi:hypothetical protein
MTPQVLHCNTTVYGFGDNTAGPIWRHTVSPGSPLWGYEHTTNYPVGEDLNNPVNYAGSVQYSLYWGLTKAAGTICGYNIMNMIGFVASALAMYGFVYAFTHRRWIAILAGYAVSFSPYFQVKVGGHPSYGYQAILIGLIWAFFNLLKYQRKKDALILGGLFGICGYWDPYFLLLGIVILFPLALVWAVLNIRNLFAPNVEKDKKTNSISQLKLLIFALGVSILIFLPLAAVKIKDNKQIQSYVSSSRGNVLLEARACSIYPQYYALPFALHPALKKLFGGNNYENVINDAHNQFKCGIGEDTVGISLIILAVVWLGLIVFLWERLNGRRLKLGASFYFEPRMLFWCAFAGALFAAALALPPVHFHHIPSPSAALLSLTSTWRTLARLYVVVNIFTVSLFSIFLVYFSTQFKKHKKLLKYLFIAIFLIMFIEYQAFEPFKGNTLSTFNYKTSAPPAYYWLSKQDEIKVIAEYPLERAGGESDAISYYLTMQKIHGKDLFNSALPNSSQETARSSLKDISDPQTIPTLYTLGVDTIVIHGVPVETVEKIPNLKIIYTAPQANFNLLPHTPTVKKDNLVIARIINSPQENSMIELAEGFPRNALIIHSAADWQYEALQNSIIDIANVTKTGVRGTSTNDPASSACFEIKMAASQDKDTVTFDIDGKDASSIALDNSYKKVELAAKHSIILHNRTGHNMRIQNLGC